MKKVVVALSLRCGYVGAQNELTGKVTKVQNVGS